MVNGSKKASVNIPITISIDSFHQQQRQCIHDTCNNIIQLMIKNKQILKYTFCSKCGQVYYIDDLGREKV